MHMIFYSRLLRLGSFSPSRIILDRTRSSSLVDMPTFISHSVTLCSIVKMTDDGEDSFQSEKTPGIPRGRHFKLERQERKAKKFSYQVVACPFSNWPNTALKHSLAFIVFAKIWLKLSMEDTGFIYHISGKF